MILTRYILDLWDPSYDVRNGDRRISICQTISLPFLIVGILITYPIDIITFPLQRRYIYRDD